MSIIKGISKEVTKTWITGARSATMVIPAKVAAEHGLQEPAHVVVESVNPGYVVKDKCIVIRRIEV